MKWDGDREVPFVWFIDGKRVETDVAHSIARAINRFIKREKHRADADRHWTIRPGLPQMRVLP